MFNIKAWGVRVSLILLNVFSYTMIGYVSYLAYYITVGIMALITMEPR